MKIYKKPYLVEVLDAGPQVHKEEIESVLENMNSDGYEVISIVPNTYSTRENGLQVTLTNVIITGRLIELTGNISGTDNDC